MFLPLVVVSFYRLHETQYEQFVLQIFVSLGNVVLQGYVATGLKWTYTAHNPSLSLETPFASLNANREAHSSKSAKTLTVAFHRGDGRENFSFHLSTAGRKISDAFEVEKLFQSLFYG